ncbi:DUF2852 domain-containing protein [Rhodospirillaceae bacterium SYSU D60014]|uniref:DUF2852 domain-containing protein n=1 Tax=Virgifigura deserti TaxID=2268457 RepID=UPI000E670310
MAFAAKIDEWGKPAWIGLVILGFLTFWPLGLAILGYLIWSGRMGCWNHGGRGRWHNVADRAQGNARRWCGGAFTGSSGNVAFDEYRADTLRRLEEEEQEFKAFLDRLRQAKDKSEFDQFMAERGRRPDASAPEAQG